MYSTVIVGGGIGGINTCYRLEKIGHKCLVIEKNNILGGRIKLDPNYNYEIGGARFSFKHKNLISLLKELKLLDNKIAIPSTKVFKSIKKRKINHTQIYNIIKNIIKKSKNFDIEYLRNNTFLDLCTKIYSKKDTKILLDSYYYTDFLLNTSAENSLLFFKETMNLDEQYYILGGGLIQIINKIKTQLKSKIMLETILEDYKYIDNHFEIIINKSGKKSTVKADNLVLAIDRPSLLKINSLKSIKSLLNTISNTLLIRVYAMYPKNKDGKVWFDKIPKIYTDSHLKYIIPIDYNSGLIMISYTDLKHAEIIKKHTLNGTLKQFIQSECKKIFPDKVIPSPTYLNSHIWDNGVGLWKKGVNFKEISNKIIKPFNYPLYICGENYSLHQGWIEGALDTSLKVVKKMTKVKRTKKQKGGKLIKIKSNGKYKKILFDSPIKNIKIKKSNKKPIKNTNYGFTKGKNLLWVDEGLKLEVDIVHQENKKQKKYSLTEVSQHNTPDNAWIVIDNNVYDITKWIPFHPGGPIIMEGLGKDATKMFNNVNHTSNARRKLHQFKIGYI
jgi:cytochrome b involved in lipid metabolism/monoamine oxidase